MLNFLQIERYQTCSILRQVCYICASPVATGGFWGLAPPQTKLQVPPNWNIKHYKSNEFLKIFRLSSPPAQTQSPPAEKQTPLLKTFWRWFWSALHNILLFMDGTWLLVVPVETAVDLQLLETMCVVIQLAKGRNECLSY